MFAARLLLLALALLVARPAAAQAVLALDPEQQVDIEAEQLVWEEGGLVRAEGGVRLRSGTVELAAEQIVYDTTLGRVQLEGGFTLVDGSFVARADRGSFDLRTGTGVLEDVALWEKRTPIPAAELFAARPAELGLLGRNAVTLRAPQITRQQDGTWVASHPTVTTCDCDGDSPSWTMGASSASVGTDDTLRLRWPVLYARGIPVAAFPYFSLPIATGEGDDRKTGLLAPDVNLSSRRGFSYEQPLFLVLGQPYDATLSAGYFFGSTDEDTMPGWVGGTPAEGEFEVNRAFRGPRFTGEFRYVPREGTVGRLFGAYAHDLSYRLPRQGSLVPGTVPEDPEARFPVSGPDRFLVQLDHADNWSHGLADRISLNLASDRFYLRDFTDEVVRRDNGVLTSSAWFARREGPLLLVAEGTYLQDMRLPFEREAELDGLIPTGFFESPDLFGAERRNTFARLPAFAVDLAGLQLPGGAGLSLHAGAARFAPLTSTGFGDEGLDGIAPGDPGYPGPDAGENDGILEPGERAAATRLALRPTLSLPVVAGRFLSITPTAGWRQQFYAYDAAEDGHVGYGVLGLDVQTQLARTFSGGGIRHAFLPRLQLRGLFPGDEDAAPERAYDELDVRPLESFGQAQLALGTRVDVARPGGGVAVVEAEVGQDFLLAPEASPVASFVRADLSVRPLRLEGLLRFENEDRELSEVAASAAVTADRGHQLRAGFRRLAAGGSSRLLAGPDQLFAPGTVGGRPLASALVETPTEKLEQVSAGATVIPLEGLSLRYDLLLLTTLESDPILEQRAAIAYLSPCDCWAGELRFAVRRGETMPDIGFSFDLGGLLQL